MAADAEIEGGAEGDGTAKKGKKLFILIGAAAAVVLAGGAGLYVFLSAGQAPASAESHEVAASAPQTFIFNLQPMTVNLAGDGGQAGFLRLSIALEVANEQAMTDLQPRLAKVTDAFQVYLRELRRSDLEGSAGIYRLKEELLRRVNMAAYPVRVHNILFRELLVQ